MFFNYAVSTSFMVKAVLAYAVTGTSIPVTVWIRKKVDSFHNKQINYSVRVALVLDEIMFYYYFNGCIFLKCLIF